MDFHTFGKPGNPAVLLIPGGGLSWGELRGALKPLESDYFLILPAFDPGQSVSEQADALEACLLRDFAGRIWGAYGLREGGAPLLTLLERGGVRLRTAVLDGTSVPEPPADLTGAGARLVYWLGSRDRAAGKSRKALKTALPALHTVTFKKLGSDRLFVQLRPDLAAKRLTRTFGRARTVSLTALLPASGQRLWDLLPLRKSPRAARVLSESDPVVADAGRRVYITGGRGKLVRLWSHLVRLESVSDEETLCTDQVEMAAGLLSGAVGLWTKGYLRRGQRRLRRQLRAENRRARRK